MTQLSRNRLLLLLVIAICGAGYGSAVSEGAILLQTRYPVQNEKTRILVQTVEGNPITGATVTVKYRPGSQVEVESEIGTTDEGGGVDWIPEDAGIVSITAGWMGEDRSEVNITTNVSVKFSSPPMSGMLIMVLAGVLLIGGSILRFARYIWGKEF